MPSKSRGFAFRTEVEVAQSRAEIETHLARAGAGQIVGGWDRDNRSGFVIFGLAGRQYRLDVPRREYGKANPDQIDRERWRALLLIVKAKLEVIRSDLSTVEQEFLPYLLLPNGSTVAQEVLPRIAEMYASGAQVPLLPGFHNQLGEGT